MGKLKKTPFFDPDRTKELQDMHQSYGRGGVVMALIVSLIVLASILYYLF